MYVKLAFKLKQEELLFGQRHIDKSAKYLTGDSWVCRLNTRKSSNVGIESHLTKKKKIFEIPRQCSMKSIIIMQWK